MFDDKIISFYFILLDICCLNDVPGSRSFALFSGGPAAVCRGTCGREIGGGTWGVLELRACC